MPCAPAASAEMLDGIKAIAAFLEETWSTPERPIVVSLFQVVRAIRRRRDPLPSYKPMGKRFAYRAEVRCWAERQVLPPGDDAPPPASPSATTPH